MRIKIFFLDNSVFGNKNFSKKAPIFSRVFMLSITILYLAFIIYLIIDKNDLTKIPYLLHAGILFVLVIFQSIVFTKYGRKFLQCTEESLIVKHRYFEKSRSFSWPDIRSIRFVGQSFVIVPDDTGAKEITFKAPLELYLDIRNYLKEHAGHLTIIEE